MKRTTMSALYAGAVLSLAALAQRRWVSSLPKAQKSAPDVPRMRGRRADSLAVQLDSAESWTVDNDPFRLSNSPATVAYTPASDGTTASGGPAAFTPPPLRPRLILKAVVGGPPWQAIIDGFPGQPAGTIARSGSVFDKLTVRAVTRDSVIVQGPDTSWVLSFRKRS